MRALHLPPQTFQRSFLEQRVCSNLGSIETESGEHTSIAGVSGGNRPISSRGPRKGLNPELAAAVKIYPLLQRRPNFLLDFWAELIFFLRRQVIISVSKGAFKKGVRNSASHAKLPRLTVVHLVLIWVFGLNCCCCKTELPFNCVFWLPSKWNGFLNSEKIWPYPSTFSYRFFRKMVDSLGKGWIKSLA